MKVKCNIITQSIKQLAKEIGKSDAYTCNLVSAWQTETHKTNPNKNDLLDYIKKNQATVKDLEFAVPCYNYEQENGQSKLVRHDGNEITIVQFNDRKKLLNKLFDSFKSDPYINGIKNDVTNSNEAYRFLLWREQSIIQHGYYDDYRDSDKATNDALTKLRLWKKANPNGQQKQAQTSGPKENKGLPTKNDTINSQLIDQLKASGINVLGKADMEKYLSEKGKLDPTYALQSINNQKELDDIKAKAISDGTFMKAPNGKPTNLTERQWLQVRTKAFKEWFGDWINDPANASKVVDENGEPLVVYHSNDAEEFDSTRQYNWFSSKRQNHYGYHQYPVFLNIKNLFKRDDPTMDERAMITDYGTGDKYDKLPKEYDGAMVYHNTFGYYEILTTRSSNQVKSATDNNGMFSTENDDIRMAIENTSKEHGVTIQTESLNIKGNKFKHSLYRGQGYAPVIDAEGNLHLHTNYDSLSKLRTLSFDSTIEGAEQYGHRAALNPYIIEIDEDFLDTILPKGEYNRDKINRGESFRYDEEFNEVRLSFKDELIIPKGKFNITQTNETLRLEDFNDIMSSIGQLQSLEERAEIEENNGASEITGRVHENDINSLGNALQNTLGTYKGYNVFTILYDVLALQNSTSGSPIGPSRQYREFIDKGLIETENHNGYIYYRPSKDLIKHLTKNLD